MQVEDLFRQGVVYFNAEYFFEAHDVFEEIWMDTRGRDRRFYQGLVQLATGFYHLRMNNPEGGLSQLSKGVEKLRSFPVSYQTIDLSDLLMEVNACIKALKSVTFKDFAFSMVEDGIPKIRTIDR